MSKHYAFAIALLSVFAVGSSAQTFDDVKVRFCPNPAKCRLVEKGGSLAFDSNAKELRVVSDDKPSIFRYDEIETIVFDVTTHMRGGATAALIGGFLGGAIANGNVNDYWLYIRDKMGIYTVLEIPRKSSLQVIATARAAFGSRVIEFSTIHGADIRKKDVVADLKVKYRIAVNKSEHPIPSPKSGKALIVVADPLLPEVDQYQQRLYADDQLIAINLGGTYSFAYVDPGEHLFFNKGDNFNGFKLKVEAGQGYYFVQNQVSSNAETLSLQSPEVVLHEISGLRWMEWVKK